MVNNNMNSSVVERERVSVAEYKQGDMYLEEVVILVKGTNHISHSSIYKYQQHPPINMQLCHKPTQ